MRPGPHPDWLRLQELERDAERVRALLSRATDGGASEEEQRTSAHIAARIMKKAQLLIVTGANTTTATASTPAAPSPRPSGMVVITSKYAGRCRECGSSYVPGDAVYWARGAGARHPQCARAA